MKATEWERVKTIFEAARNLDPPARRTFLDDACGQSSELKSELESLLCAWDKAGEFLDTPAVEANAAEIADAVHGADAGLRLGAYRTVREIGHGGMGVVYEALRDDDEYRQRVAIKLIAFGMATDPLRQRFRSERQILAGLDHPNIARLLDGGTTAGGQPYLVMEYVEGVPLTEYCARERLGTRERLKLFRTICSAVHAAHRRLIVHRDLKPGNVLVTSDGAPKLLDFGIAKALGAEDRGEETGITAVMYTPEYASPEQVRGEPVTTATDVYSLGVILYELLTGCLPYSLGGLSSFEAAQAICAAPPAKPSSAAPALRKTLDGDLDNILLKALHKDPERRYASAEQFSEDIQRHLSGAPVLARADTVRYRAAKFARRHSIGLAAVAAILALLAGGFAATLWQYRVAQAQSAKAERRFNDVRHLANSLLFEVYDSIRDLPGSTPARKIIVGRALEYLDSLAKEAGGDDGLRRELATAYDRVGDVQGGYRSANLGDTAGALSSYRKALAIRESLAASDPNNAALLRDLVPSHGKVGDLLGLAGNWKEAMDHSRRLVDIAESLNRLSPGDPRNQRLLATAYLDYGYKQGLAGDWTNGLAMSQKAIPLLVRLAAAEPGDRRIRRTLSLAYLRAGRLLLWNTDRYREALAMGRNAQAVTAGLISADPRNTDYRQIAAWAGLQSGEALELEGDVAGASGNDEAGLRQLEALSSADPNNAQFQADVALALSQSAVPLAQLGRSAEALRRLDRALELIQTLPGTNTYSQDPLSIRAISHFRQGNIQERLGHWKQAADGYRRSQPEFIALRERGLLYGTLVAVYRKMWTARSQSASRPRPASRASRS